MEAIKKDIKHSQRVSRRKNETLSIRDRIKPRGLSGLYKGKIHYDENADIFNLSL